MEDASTEMVLAAEILRDAGNYANVTDYEEDRLAGNTTIPCFLHSFIILDEPRNF